MKNTEKIKVFQGNMFQQTRLKIVWLLFKSNKDQAVEDVDFLVYIKKKKFVVVFCILVLWLIINKNINNNKNISAKCRERQGPLPGMMMKR